MSIQPIIAIILYLIATIALGLKIYGAGILSSFGESNASITTERTHLVFDIEEVLIKSFFTDKQQNEYFVINSFEELFASLELVIKNWNYEYTSESQAATFFEIFYNIVVAKSCR